MNREAASETQYEDSKSHLSTYRKDNKSMLRRKLLPVLLALVLVVSMAVPALAASWSGTWDAFNCVLTASRSTTSGTATMKVTNINVNVEVRARASVNVLILGGNYAGYWRSANGAMTATTTVDNYYYDSEGVMYSGAIVTVTAKGYVGSNYVYTIYD